MDAHQNDAQPVISSNFIMPTGDIAGRHFNMPIAYNNVCSFKEMLM